MAARRSRTHRVKAGAQRSRDAEYGRLIGRFFGQAQIAKWAPSRKNKVQHPAARKVV